MARSVYKGPFFDFYLLKKVLEARQKGLHAVIKTYSRRSTIIREFVGAKFAVHNGKQFVVVSVKEEMVGRKLGEFVPTRKFGGHGADKVVKKG